MKLQSNVKIKANSNYTLPGYIIVLFCLTVIMLGLGLYLHFSCKFNMNNFWGIYPLIIGIPSLLIGGFNIIYFGLTSIGSIWLTFANVSDKPLACLISLGLLGIIGLISYFINKDKK